MNPVYFAYNPDSIRPGRCLPADPDQPARRYCEPQLDHQAAVPAQHRYRSIHPRLRLPELVAVAADLPEHGLDELRRLLPAQLLRRHVHERRQRAVRQPDQRQEPHQLRSVRLLGDRLSRERRHDAQRVRRDQPQHGSRLVPVRGQREAPDERHLLHVGRQPRSAATAATLRRSACARRSATAPAESRAARGSCNGDPCAWFVAENGRYGGGNFAKPNFGWLSLQDQWKPSEQLLFNIGAALHALLLPVVRTPAVQRATSGSTRGTTRIACFPAAVRCRSYNPATTWHEPACPSSGSDDPGDDDEPAERHRDLHGSRASRRRHVHGQPGQRHPLQLRPLQPAAEHGVRAVQPAPARPRVIRCDQLLADRLHDDDAPRSRRRRRTTSTCRGSIDSRAAT